MSELEQSQTKPGYSPAKLIQDLHGGLFRELTVQPLDIDLYRRNLQRTFTELLSAQLKTPAANSDLPAYARAELENLQDQIKKTDAKRAKPVLQAHLKDLSARITKALDLRAPGAGQ